MPVDFKNWPDEMSLYFRQDIPINERIVLKQPTIGDIVAFGEARYFSMAKTLVTIPSDLKPELFDIGIDYETLPGFDLFCMLTAGLTNDDTRLLLGDVDFRNFVLCVDKRNDEKILYDEKTDTIIDRRIYMLITKYVCKLHGFKQKVEHAANKFTKKIMIEDDRMRKEMERKKPYESSLLPIVSSLVNSPGFKYDSQSVMRIGIYELRDSIERIQIIRNADALLHGIYGGMIDTSKINKKELDWTRRL